MIWKECEYRISSDTVIYAVRCIESQRVYIGSTSCLKARLAAHFSELKRGAKPSLWQTDYDKYGRDSFEFYVLEKNVSYAKRSEREDYWIRKYRASEPEHGYNLKTVKTNEFVIKPGSPPLPQ